MNTQDGTVLLTDRERAASDYAMLSLGFAYGNTVAQIIIAKFPDGFSEEVGDEIAKIVSDGIKVNVDYFVSKGVERSSLDAYEAAYHVAVRNAFSTYADDCRSRAAA